MGRLSAVAMREMLAEDQALRWHLEANHYPPVHSSFVPAAQEALANVRAGEYQKEINLPNGRVLTTAEVVEGLHLDAFLEDEDGLS